MKFEILTEVLVKIQVLWILTPCQPGSSYCCFGVHKTFCTSGPRRVHITDCLILKVDAVNPSQMPVIVCQFTQCNMSENFNLPTPLLYRFQNDQNRPDSQACTHTHTHTHIQCFPAYCTWTCVSHLLLKMSLCLKC